MTYTKTDIKDYDLLLKGDIATPLQSTVFTTHTHGAITLINPT